MEPLLFYLAGPAAIVEPVAFVGLVIADTSVDIVGRAVGIGIVVQVLFPLGVPTVDNEPHTEHTQQPLDQWRWIVVLMQLVPVGIVVLVQLVLVGTVVVELAVIVELVIAADIADTSVDIVERVAGIGIVARVLFPPDPPTADSDERTAHRQQASDP